ncbi:MAG: flagellar hook-basal body complex protein [Rickettsiales bacterium]
MTLYSALFTGVSGLNAQGQKIGIISDNIANVNTVGYKQAQANFSTLVVNAAGASTYSPGGVINRSRLDIQKQGVISSTAAPTDLAITGKGFFVVNQNSAGTEQPLYTRAGSFRQDASGNFVNAQGFYLQGWPLDREGRLPGEPGNLNTVGRDNLDSLETVSVTAATGEPEVTTSVELGLNLDAGQEVYHGSGATVTMDVLSPNNYHINSETIIVPDEINATPPSFGLAPTNNIARGDKFTLSTGNGLSYTYQYGGFTMGRQVNVAGAANVGDGASNISPISLPAGAMTTDGATTLVTVTLAGPHGYSTGDVITLSGVTFAGADTIPISEINTAHTITVTGANTFTFNTTTASTVADANAAGGTYTDRRFVGNILDATTGTQALLGTTGTANYTSASLSFTISTPSSGSHTFTYRTGSVAAENGQFNTLNNLATAIDAAAGLTARVVNGRLVIGAEDATESVTFANVDATGSGTLLGIDWVQELDLKNVTAASRRFSTMANLADLVNADEGVSAVLNDPLGESTLEMRGDDPLDTVRFQDFVGVGFTAGSTLPMAAGSINSAAGGPGPVVVTVTLPGHGLSVGNNIALSGVTPFGGFTAGELNTTHTITNVLGPNTFEITINASGAIAAAANTDGNLANSNTGSLLAEFGIVPSLNGGAYVRGDSGSLGPEYDSSGTVGHNMASEEITAQFTRNIRVYDALGGGHDLRMSTIKIDENTWAVEIFSPDEDDISSTLVDGQVATGTITFNGDGSLRNVSSGLANDIVINWTNGSVPSTINIDWGTAGLPFGTPGASQIGDTDGITQFDSDYNVAFVRQDGSGVGNLTGVTIDDEGYVVASYSNGEIKKLYKLPIADFSNPNGLQAITGNVFAQTLDSGDVYLREAGENGVGTIQSSALEQSNVDLAEQLTDMIVAQRAYQSNTKVISTADDLLDRLNQI